jgi:hypothetical protein
MSVRYFIAVLVAFSSLPASGLSQEAFPPAPAQVSDFSSTVFPITTVGFYGPLIRGWFGTGFCLDPACRFIGTNYHVAAEAKPKRILGIKIARQYLATSPDDENATLNPQAFGGRPLRFTLSRDLAIFELRNPLPHHHGVGFNIDDLEAGDEVEIYTYPKESINPVRSLLEFHGTFKGETTTGLLAFDYSLAARKAIRGGASGGIVVGSKSQEIVGILNSIALDGETVALAVPVQSLVDFVSKVQPCLAQRIFPPANGIPEISADIFPKFMPPTPSHSVEHRPDEPTQVTMLRTKAQLLADSMRNFIAVQTFAWGSGDRPPVAAAAYEVRVLDGYQRFREYPDGRKEIKEAPFPAPLNTAISIGGAWSDLPLMVGSEFDLQIRQAGEAVIDGRRIRVFQYRAETEDGACQFKSIFDFGFFVINKIATVACYGEVWTDEDSNIIRMSEHLELLGKWKRYQTVVTYGWLPREDEASRLVPLTISAQAEYNKKVYWCRGRFMDYKVFSSRVKIGGGLQTVQLGTQRK